MIEIENSDLDKAAKLLEAFPGAIDKVSKKAVREDVKDAKKEATAKIVDRYTIQKGRVGKTMRVQYHGAGAIFSSRGPVNDLSYFKHNPRSVLKHRPTKGQYLYSQVVKGQGGTIAHAFLARMRSGHVGVFQRAGHGTSNASLTIYKLAGPSTPQMLGSPTIQSYMEQHLKTRFSEAMERDTLTYLEGLHL